VNANTRLHDEFFLIHLAIAIHDLQQYTMAISHRSLSNSNCLGGSLQSLTVKDHIDNFLARKFRKSRSFATTRSYKNINKFLENREETLSEKEVKKIIKKLKGHVTK
jgi:hypothetical protein